MGYPLPERLILTEPRYFPVLSEMLRERPLEDFKDYAALQVILEYSDMLTTEFEEPSRALAEVLSGVAVLAYEALLHYLEEHPEENVEIDGMTPTQRCFIAWAQMWTWKATDQFISTIVATDGHPPLQYRAVAPLQHLDAFYDAFGIEEGDPMWLPPEQRVNAW